MTFILFFILFLQTCLSIVMNKKYRYLCTNAASKSIVLRTRNTQVKYAYLITLLKYSKKVFGPPTAEFGVQGGDGMNAFR